MLKIRCLGMMMVLVMTPALSVSQDAGDKPQKKGKRAGGVRVQAVKITEVREADVSKRKKKQDDIRTFNFSMCPSGLTVQLEISGRAAGRATHYGMLRLDTARDDHDRKMKLNEESTFNTPTEKFAEINRDMMFMGMQEKPKDKLLIDLKLTLPARDATALDLEGALQLKIADVKKITIKNVAERKGAIEHKALKSTGLTCEIGEITDTTLALTLTGQIDNVLAVGVEDGGGKSISAGYSRSTLGSTAKYELMLSNPAGEDARLVLEVEVGEEIVDVPFSFEKLPLP